MTSSEIEQHLIAMEAAALERWCNGDPDGFLEISAPDVAYFDPFQPSRIDSLEDLRELYNGLRGKAQTDRFEIIDPRAQVFGELAILTFQFTSHSSEGAMRWNTTEVYRQTGAGWRIVHTHWSLRK